MPSLLYIAFIIGLCLLTHRYAPKYKLKSEDGSSNLFFFGCFLFGALIGWAMPELLQKAFAWSFGDSWLTRVAKIVGAIGGFFIAARGLAIWGTIFVAGVVVTGLSYLGSFVFGWPHL